MSSLQKAGGVEARRESLGQYHRERDHYCVCDRRWIILSPLHFYRHC